MFDYSFVAWPDEENRRVNNPAVFTLFRSLNTRVELIFTEKAFGLFRDQLAKAGITLREIERRPHHEPETIV